MATLLDRPPSSHRQLDGPPMSDFAVQSVSSDNQQVYQRLKLALSLDLRRQLFVVVCDDLNLRNRLAGQLHRELAKHPSSANAAPSNGAAANGGASSNGFVVHGHAPLEGEGAAEHWRGGQRDRLVSLKLDLGDPNPIAQVSHWLRKQTGADVRSNMPAFQILGIEQLTRQPAAVQRLFLSYLRTLERHLPALNSGLVLWVTQPWYHNIRQSAPECWQWCSGVFEFVSEPLPLFTNDDVPQGSGIENSTVMAVQQAVATAQRIAPVAKQAPQDSQVPVSAAAADAPAVPSVRSIGLVQDAAVQDGAVQDGVAQEAESKTDADVAEAAAVPVAKTQSNAAPAQARLPAPPPAPGATEAEQQEAKLLATIETLRSQSGASEALALAYLDLGRFYRQRMEKGDTSQDFTRYAIVAYEQVLEWLCFNDPGAETSNISWPDTLNDLGTLYWMASRQPESPEMGQSYLRLAIQTYRLGLKNTDPEQQSRSYAMLQNNLGTVHSDQAHQQDPIDNLQQAVTAYQEALRFRQPEHSPQKYASTQNNLGTAYWHLAQHEKPPENLKSAIAAYSQAAQYYNPDEQPDSYAMIQNNLGTAYWNLAQHAPATEPPSRGDGDGSDESATFMAQDWLLLAVNAYNNALRFRTLQVAPGSYAATQNNLGTAYWQLANQAQDNVAAAREYLQLSIRAYGAALKAAAFLQEHGQAALLNFDLSSTHSNLGLVHFQLATDYSDNGESENQEEHLDNALTHHVNALEGWQQKPELQEAAMEVLTQTVRKYYEIWGSSGQNRALAQVPGTLLPQLLPKL